MRGSTSGKPDLALYHWQLNFTIFLNTLSLTMDCTRFKEGEVHSQSKEGGSLIHDWVEFFKYRLFACASKLFLCSVACLKTYQEFSPTLFHISIEAVTILHWTLGIWLLVKNLDKYYTKSMHNVCMCILTVCMALQGLLQSTKISFFVTVQQSFITVALKISLSVFRVFCTESLFLLSTLLIVRLLRTIIL